MRNLIKIFYAFILLALINGCSMDPPAWAKTKHEIDPNHLTIGVSLSTLNNPFFVSIKEGITTAAAKEHMQVKIADAQNDSAKQNNDVEDLIQQGVDILLINPVDSDAISSAILLANQSGVSVITIDRSATKGNVVTFIASNNIEGGKMAAQFIVSKLGKKAVVAELQGIPGASATRERGQGFHLIADKELNVIASQSADFDRAKGLTVAENILQAHDNVQAIFAQNDEMALGAYEAAKSAGKNIIIVGFDGSQDGLKSVQNGQLSATVAQQPDLIGEKAIEASKQIANKESIPPQMPVALKLVTK
jgi:ribose transport system substrate-binding protein